MKDDKYYRYYRVEFKDFGFDVIVGFHQSMNREEKKTKIKRKIKERLKVSHFDKVRDRYGNDYVGNKYHVNLIQSDWSEPINTIWYSDRPRYKILSLTKLPKCEGCRLNCPGQDDHMDVDGCLYQSEDESYE